jgi:hypothetical protein
MKNKRIAAGLAAFFCVLLVALVVVTQITRPAPQAGGKTITVEVVHGDGSTAQFTYETSEEYLAQGRLTEELIAGSDSAYGLYVETVDGETADYSADSSYWWISVNGEDATVGVDSIPVQDGDTYTFTYTVG